MECVVPSKVMDDWLHRLSSNLARSPPAPAVCPTVCRRAASFPTVNHEAVMQPLLKVRSKSESEALNRFDLSNHFFVDFATNTEKFKEDDSSGDDDSMTETESEDAISGVEASTNEEEKEEEETECAKENVVTTEQPDEKEVVVPSIEANTSKMHHKCVRFADDCGQVLASVRIMTEPSDYPPTINPAVLKRILGADFDDETKSQPSALWEVAFRQPASEYVKFRETLERGMVALENVVLKNESCHMVGTVKVKNISFEKRVYVRLTANGWSSFMDYPAKYQSSSSKIYDTFCFDIEIPPNSPNCKEIQFCVCFEAGPATDDSKPVQYWDSNDGKNYQLIVPQPQSEPRQESGAAGFDGESYLKNQRVRRFVIVYVKRS